MKKSKIRFTQKNNCNYCHLSKKDIFHDTFAYIDIDEKVIEKLLSSKGIVATIDKNTLKSNNPYRIFFIRCRKKDSDTFRTEIFPKLHHKIAHKMGNDYLDFCEIFYQTLSTNLED